MAYSLIADRAILAGHGRLRESVSCFRLHVRSFRVIDHQRHASPYTAEKILLQSPTPRQLRTLSSSSRHPRARERWRCNLGGKGKPINGGQPVPDAHVALQLSFHGRPSAMEVQSWQYSEDSKKIVQRYGLVPVASHAHSIGMVIQKRRRVARGEKIVRQQMGHESDLPQAAVARHDDQGWSIF